MIGLYSDLFSPLNDSQSPLLNQRYECQIDILFQGVFSKFNGIGKVFCISGKCGSGKTTLFKRICKEKQINIIEFNPETEVYSEIFSQAVQKFIKKCSILSSKENIILFDSISFELSDLHNFILVLQSSPIPKCWILTQEQSEIRTIPFPIQKLTLPQNKGIRELIYYICQKLNITIDEESVQSIINNANGDIRTALNSLQFGCVLHHEQQLFTRSKAAQIFRGFKSHAESIDDIDIYSDYNSLCLCYDSLHQVYGDVDDYLEEIDYFSLFDVYDGFQDTDNEETKNIQDVLAFSIAVNNSKPRFSPLLPLSEQIYNRSSDLNNCSLEDKIMFLSKQQNDELFMEEEEENDPKAREVLESIRLLELDPIESEPDEEENIRESTIHA